MPNDQPQTQLYSVNCKWYDWRGISHCESIPIHAVTKVAAESAARNLLNRHNPRGCTIDYVAA